MKAPPVDEIVLYLRRARDSGGAMFEVLFRTTLLDALPLPLWPHFAAALREHAFEHPADAELCQQLANILEPPMAEA